jgi:hypothetical protein
LVLRKPWLVNFLIFGSLETWLVFINIRIKAMTDLKYTNYYIIWDRLRVRVRIWRTKS